MNMRIKEICKEKNVSIGELASQIGIARESVSRIIGGANTTTDTLQKIADALNVPLSDLFDKPKTGVFNCPNCGARIRAEKED